MNLFLPPGKHTASPLQRSVA